MSLQDFTFYSLVERNALMFRNKDAWFEEKSKITLSFNDIKIKSDQLACGLMKAGINKGDRIGIMVKTVLNFFSYIVLLQLLEL